MSSGPAGIFYRDTHTLKDTLGNDLDESFKYAATLKPS
jgi:hypothetical protein